ncbi:hypothetical protein [Ascidiimonas sp. W6]|uniref:hypothetical protein n=1 Tax=Ascidiimonas meishanensis TaxID=3128903 RepID=UPI0030ED4E82
MVSAPFNSLQTQEQIKIITAFLESIGITILYRELDNSCFLPGIKLLRGSILLDINLLKYPGDLLHEAGHIAITDAPLRAHIGTDKMSAEWPSQGDEIAAMLWSYAALYDLKLSPEVVFHSGGYKKDSQWLIDEFKNKRYPGLPLLEWMGFCYSAEKAVQKKKPAFPYMLKWLR